MVNNKAESINTASNLTSKQFYIKAECSTNRYNTMCLLVFAIACVLCECLNEINVFEVTFKIMRIGTTFGIVFFMIPVITLWKPLCLFKKDTEAIVYKEWFKFYILFFTWLGTMSVCIMLTHHAVLVMAIPILMMSQYKETKVLVHLTIVLAIICVLLGVYGGYFWGCFDANMLQTALTDNNAFDLEMRASMATGERMMEIFLHYALGRIIVVISLITLASGISQRNHSMLSQQVQLQLKIRQEMRHTNEIQCQVIDGMANLIENRDASTGEHVKRTEYYVKSIVNQLLENSIYSIELSGNLPRTIEKAAPLHDIGKIVVTDRILQKPGKLTPEEYEEIKRHTTEGAMIIKNVLGNIEDDEFLKIAIEIAESHHERWDGNGYPKGLSGKDIPLAARIMAVADVFDALVSKRVYKQPMAIEEAFKIIECESGKQFDPDVVSAFIQLRPQIIHYLKDNNTFNGITC